MTARKLTKEDLPEANIISALAFHVRTDDPKKVENDFIDDPAEQWGAFSD